MKISGGNVLRIFARLSSLSLRGYSTVFDILDRGSEQNGTSYRNSENPERKIYPFASDQK
jgi:hypothetical protein